VRLALRRWAWALVWQTPLRADHHRLRRAATARRPRITMADQHPGTIHPPDQTIRAGTVAQAHPAALDRKAGPVRKAAPVTRVIPETLADPMIMADLRVTTRAITPVARAITPVARGDPRPAHGAVIPSAATSMAPRGAMERHPGDGVRRHGQRGTGRSRRPAGSGDMAQSITGATTKRPCGIPDLTSGASRSSESGSRCNR
jgi:hypothetical protein